MVQGRDKVSPFADTLVIQPLSIDDLSAVRYVHQSAFRLLAGASQTEDEVRSFIEFTSMPAYADSILDNAIDGAWLDGQLIATAGWIPSDDSGDTARIKAVFVNPLFARLGVGTVMVRRAEAIARKAGFREFRLRANLSAVPLFARLGYEVASHGVRPMCNGSAVRVTFMRRCDAAAQPEAQPHQSRAGDAVVTPAASVYRPH